MNKTFIRKFAAISALLFGLNSIMPFFAGAQELSTIGVSLNRGDFSIDATPTGFDFPPIHIDSPKNSYNSYYNSFTSDNGLSLHDGRYSGGIRVTIQASDYDPGTPENPADDLPVSNLAIVTSNNNFDEILKTGTPAMYAPLDGDPSVDADYTNFTNANTPIIILDGANLTTPDCNIGRVGTYTVYPSFRLTVPNDTAAGNYSSTFTYDLMQAPTGC